MMRNKTAAKIRGTVCTAGAVLGQLFRLFFLVRYAMASEDVEWITQTIISAFGQVLVRSTAALK